MTEPIVKHSTEYVTLRDYIDTCLAARDKAAEIANYNRDKATETAYHSLEKRLDVMNEFRESLKDQNATFVTKAEYKASQEFIEKDVRDLRDFKATVSGKASQTMVVITTVIAIIGFISSMISLFKLLGL